MIMKNATIGEEVPTKPVGSAQPSVMAHPPHLGRMGELTSGRDWKHYVKRLKMFFKVNSAGRQTSVLRFILAPKKPEELNFTEIVDTLAQHVNPKRVPLIIAERYKFHKAEGEELEIVQQYLAKLRKLAETCEFALYREEATREGFVCGLRLQLIQPKLLAEATLALHTAVERACATDLTEKEESRFHGDFHLDVKKVEGTFLECSRCGKTSHSPEKCFIGNHSVTSVPEIWPYRNEVSGEGSLKAKGGESKKTEKKKKTKFGGIHNIEEMETIVETVDKPSGLCLPQSILREDVKHRSCRTD